MDVEEATSQPQLISNLLIIEWGCKWIHLFDQNQMYSQLGPTGSNQQLSPLLISFYHIKFLTSHQWFRYFFNKWGFLVIFHPVFDCMYFGDIFNSLAYIRPLLPLSKFNWIVLNDYPNLFGINAYLRIKSTISNYSYSNDRKLFNCII